MSRAAPVAQNPTFPLLHPLFPKMTMTGAGEENSFQMQILLGTVSLTLLLLPPIPISQPWHSLFLLRWIFSVYFRVIVSQSSSGFRLLLMP